MHFLEEGFDKWTNYITSFIKLLQVIKMSLIKQIVVNAFNWCLFHCVAFTQLF